MEIQCLLQLEITLQETQLCGVHIWPLLQFRTIAGEKTTMENN